MTALAARRFWWFVGGAVAVAVAVRLGYVARSTVPSEPGFLVSFDPIYYHRQALAVAHGHGFTAPYRSDGAPSADHPPLLVVVLALATKLGLGSWAAHRALTAVIGAAVVPLLAVLGRRLAGARAGVVAAALGAVAPVLWANDGLLMPEPLYAVAVAAVLVVAHQVWDGDAPGGPWVAAAALGALVALAGLARGEGLLLGAFTVLPVALWAPALSGWRPRLGVVAVAAVTCGAVLAPWLAYNASRFEEPVLLSSSADSALAGASCDIVYAGPQVGSWNSDCFAALGSNQDLEESVFSARLRAHSRSYVRHHLADQPRVVSARLGRLWGVFRVGQGVTLDELQNRPGPVSWASLVNLWVLVPVAVVGAVRLRWARRPVVLLAAMPVFVSVVAAGFYGNPRFRVPSDLALVVVAAVALASLGARGREAPDQDAERPGAGARPERG